MRCFLTYLYVIVITFPVIVTHTLIFFKITKVHFLRLCTWCNDVPVLKMALIFSSHVNIKASNNQEKVMNNLCEWLAWNNQECYSWTTFNDFSTNALYCNKTLFLYLSVSTAFPCLELKDPMDDKLINDLKEFLEFRHEQFNLLRQNLVYKGKFSFAVC